MANFLQTRSSAVTKRPRDTSCLSVVIFNSTVLRELFFIVSYLGFGFTGKYYSILLCCLRRNVKLCCQHTIHVHRDCVCLRPRLVDLALYTAARRSRWPSNTRRKQTAGRKVRNTNYRAAVIDCNLQGQIIVDFEILAYPTCIRRPR